MPSSIDPSFPADGVPVEKAALRGQLLALRAELEHGGFVTNPVTLEESTASQALADIHAAVVPAVATIAELQSLPPVPGRILHVLGYHAPGDGGGGLFRADMSGAQATDGGMVFGHTGDESGEVVESGKTATDFQHGFSLDNANLVFGSVGIDLGTGVTLGDLDLHGHFTNNASTLAPFIDHAAGAFPSGFHIKDYLNLKATTASVAYRHLTNVRRWVRVTDGHTLDVRWFGLVQDGSDQRNRLCWALNTAHRLGFREIRLNGSYSYTGTIELPPTGVDFGWGRLTAGTGMLETLRTDYDTAYPDDRPLEIMGGEYTSIHPSSNTMRLGLRELELDGNYQNNTDGLENTAAFARADGVQSTLQNTPLWSGFSATNHGNRVVPEGQEIVIENCHFHGFGSNCIVGHGHAHYEIDNLRLGNSARNHLFYSVKGNIRGLSFYGFAWGVYGKCEHGNIIGFRIDDITDFDFAADGWTVAPQVFFYEGLRWGDGSVSTSHRYQRIGLRIEGAHIDLEGYTGTDALFPGVGRHFVLQDVVVLGPLAGASEVRLIQEIVAGNETLHDGWVVRNVSMFQRGGSRLALSSDKDTHAQFTVEDVTVSDLRGYEGATAGSTSYWTAVMADAKRQGQNADLPRRVMFNRIRQVTPLQSLLRIDVTDAAGTPVEVTVRDSTLNFNSSNPYRNKAGTGVVSGMTIQDLEKIRVFFENVRFALDLSFPQNLEMFFALTRFRGCQTFDGLKSEASGTLSLTGDGGTTIDVPTDLLWEPSVINVSARSLAAATARFAYSEVLTSDGSAGIETVADRRSPLLRLHFDQPLGIGDEVRIAWEAAVRPF